MKNLNRIAVTVLAIAACALGMTACETEHEHHGASTEHTAQYTCSMHPEVVKNSPGQCPKCGMELEAKK